MRKAEEQEGGEEAILIFLRWDWMSGQDHSPGKHPSTSTGVPGLAQNPVLPFRSLPCFQDLLCAILAQKLWAVEMVLPANL